MSAKKIEGYGNEATESWSVNHPTGSRATWLPATLVIHSGKFEPVFTQSEVVAMLREVQKLVSEGGQIVIAHDNPQAEQRWQKALRKVRSTLKNHGIEVL